MYFVLLHCVIVKQAVHMDAENVDTIELKADTRLLWNLAFL